MKAIVIVPSNVEHKLPRNAINQNVLGESCCAFLFVRNVPSQFVFPSDRRFCGPSRIFLKDRRQAFLPLKFSRVDARTIGDGVERTAEPETPET